MHCRSCGAPLPRSTRPGRPRTFCDVACRRKADNDRRSRIYHLGLAVEAAAKDLL
jgi:hypothetical protein